MIIFFSQATLKIENASFNHQNLSIKPIFNHVQALFVFHYENIICIWGRKKKLSFVRLLAHDLSSWIFKFTHRKLKIATNFSSESFVLKCGSADIHTVFFFVVVVIYCSSALFVLRVFKCFAIKKTHRKPLK